MASINSVSAIVQEIQKLEDLPSLEVMAALASLNSQLGEPLHLEEVHSVYDPAIAVSSHRRLCLQPAAPGRHPVGQGQGQTQCIEREGAGDWLNIIPSKALGLHLRRSEFLIAAKYKLGLEVFHSEGECGMSPKCPPSLNMLPDRCENRAT